jgi:NAD+-dependent protein deacetylase SIR2
MLPARKRRKIESQQRITQHLDLLSDDAQSEYDRQQALDTLLKAIKKRRKIVVVAGAGISVAAGIPDFRSSDGLFQSLRAEHKLKGSGKELFDASVYKDDSATSSFHDMVRQLALLSRDARPTLFHRLLARLSAEGRLLRVYTQNVDGLENRLPPLATRIPLPHKGPWPKTIPVHGGLEKMVCQKCQYLADLDEELFRGSVPPSCPECRTRDNIRTEHAGKRSHGIGKLRPRMVLYHESNPDEEAIGAVTAGDFKTRPDCVIVVGTSMKIKAMNRIAEEMCKIVRGRKEGTTIWINHDPPPAKFENLWDLVVRADADDIAQRVNFKEWDDTTPDIAEPYTDSDVERARASSGMPLVQVPSPKKTLIGSRLAPDTPPMSPRPTKEPETASNFILEVQRSPTKSKVSKPVLENPASKYLPLSKLSGLIKNTSKKSQTKPQTKRASGKPRQPKGQMASMFKSTKVSSTPATVAVKKEPKPLSPTQNAPAASPRIKFKPFGIKSEYTSTEASPQPESPPGLLVETPPAQRASPLPSDSRPGSSSSNQETISPSSIPKGMKDLLC